MLLERQVLYVVEPSCTLYMFILDLCWKGKDRFYSAIMVHASMPPNQSVRWQLFILHLGVS